MDDDRTRLFLTYLREHPKHARMLVGVTILGARSQKYQKVADEALNGILRIINDELAAETAAEIAAEVTRPLRARALAEAIAKHAPGWREKALEKADDLTELIREARVRGERSFDTRHWRPRAYVPGELAPDVELDFLSTANAPQDRAADEAGRGARWFLPGIAKLDEYDTGYRRPAFRELPDGAATLRTLGADQNWPSIDSKSVIRQVHSMFRGEENDRLLRVLLGRPTPRLFAERYSMKLSNLVKTLAPGVYIVASCRDDPGSPTLRDLRLQRQDSLDRRPAESRKGEPDGGRTGRRRGGGRSQSRT